MQIPENGDAAPDQEYFAFKLVGDRSRRLFGAERAIDIYITVAKTSTIAHEKTTFLDVLEQMGCTIERSPEKIFIKGNPLRGIDINMNNMPDVAQTLAVTALFAKGMTRISGIGNLKIKETDRIEALKGELSRLGARVETGEDFLIIHPGTYFPADIETYDDHRMAMSLALAGLKIPGVRIKNPNCVEKSFPDFFEQLESIL